MMEREEKPVHLGTDTGAVFLFTCLFVWSPKYDPVSIWNGF